MSLRIGVLFNCQHESLAVALQALLPHAEIISFELHKLADAPAAQERTAILLQACDHVISQDIAPGYGPLSTKLLRRSVKKFHLIPAFQFGGFHPDTVAVRLDHVPVTGPAGAYHSRIVLASYIAGLTPEESAALFNTLVFARLGYFQAMPDHAALLTEKYAAYGIDLAADLAKWLARGCFMYSINHPKMLVFLDLARIACGMMGITPGRTPLITTLPDPLAPGPVLPFLPELAARAGMQPEGAFRNALPSLPLTVLEFVQDSYKALQRVPLSCLRAADGVSEALKKLELKSAPRGGEMMPQGTTALLSMHGTIVRADLASFMLVQEKLWPASEDCIDLTFTPIPGADGVARAEIMGGVDLLPSSPPGTISVRHQQRFLSVDPARLAVPLNRQDAQKWETFLPLSLADLAILRNILSHQWLPEGEAQPILASMIGMRAGFMLDFGAFAVDILAHFPAASHEDGAPVQQYALQTNAGPRIITMVQESVGVREILLRAAGREADPDEAGSLPEFRTALNTCFSLDGPDEILHPPLTMSTADAVWLFEKHYVPDALPVGRKHYSPKLMRASGKAVLMSRGLEGIILDRTSVVKDYGFIDVLSNVKLPKGLRGRPNHVLMSEAAWHDAPKIDGPVAVFFNPNLQNYYHWLVEAALPLWIMAPYLPQGTCIIMPGTIQAMHAVGHRPLDHQGVLDALGLGVLPAIQVEAPISRVADVIWLRDAILPNVPANAMRRFRADVASRHPPASGPRQKIYVQRKRLRKVGPNRMLTNFLAKHDFVTVELEAMTPVEQIRLFQNAEMVVAPHGAGLSNLLFCPEGCRVLELTPDAEFRPFFWMIAEKLGLPYGVLRCQTNDGTFNGQMEVDFERFRALFRMLRQVDTST